jgi:oligogalacturonide transport system substrate-binding protein
MKRVTSLALAILLVFAITACSQQNASMSTSSQSSSVAPASSAPAEPPSKQVTLRFSWWGGDARHKATLAAFDKYTEKNPNIKVVGEYGAYDGAYQKLVTQLAGGGAPDICQLDAGWRFELYKQGDPYVDLYSMKDVIDMSGFDAAIMKSSAEVDGKLYGLPSGLTGETVLINKELAAKVGITGDSELTWDDYIELGKKLHAIDPKYYLLNIERDDARIVFKSYIKQLVGDQWINADYTRNFGREELVKCFNLVKQFVDDNLIQPFGENSLYDGFKLQENPKWAKGEFAMVYIPAANLPSFQDTAPYETDVIRPPIMAGAKSTGFIAQPSTIIGINKTSVDTTEAAKFLNYFFNDKDAIDILGTQRGIQPTEKGRQQMLDAGMVNKELNKAVEIALANKCEPENAPSCHPEIYDIFEDAIQKVGFDRGTPEQVADEMITLMDQKLKELKEAANAK